MTEDSKKVSFQDPQVIQENPQTPPPEAPGKQDVAESEDSEPKPPFPALVKSIKTLKEAFPDIDEKYIITVLIASNGVLDPASNALLWLSDPSFKPEINPPPTPLKPILKKSQIDEDERYARRLAQQYNTNPASTNHSDSKHSNTRARYSNKTNKPSQSQQYYDHYYKNNPGMGPNQFNRNQPNSSRQGNSTNDEIDVFFDHDLPKLKDDFTKGIKETTSVITGWMSSLKKTFEDENVSDEEFYNKYEKPLPKQHKKQHPVDSTAPPPSTVKYDAFGNEIKTNNLRKDDDNDDDTIKMVDNDDDDDDDAPPPPPRPTKNSSEITSKSTTIDKNGSETKWEPIAHTPVAVTDPFLVTDSDEEEEVESSHATSNSNTNLKEESKDVNPTVEAKTSS